MREENYKKWRKTPSATKKQIKCKEKKALQSTMMSFLGNLPVNNESIKKMEVDWKSVEELEFLLACTSALERIIVMLEAKETIGTKKTVTKKDVSYEGKK